MVQAGQVQGEVKVDLRGGVSCPEPESLCTMPVMHPATQYFSVLP